MRISLNSQIDLRSNNHYGYGKTFIEIQKSFRNYVNGQEKMLVDWNSKRSKTQLYYGSHPPENAFYSHQYKIHMSQHESTMIFPHKVTAYNAANEAWTANQWGADAMINSGVSPEKVFVYEHGLDPKEFFPALRGKNNKIRFLHVDSGSPRKRSDLVEKAFRILCKNNKNIELTLKYSHFAPTTLDWSKKETLEKSGEWVTPEIRYIKENLSPSHMSELMMFHDVLVYPSEGEGFGLIPLEAMATGMPVISTHEWSSYSKFFMYEAISSKIEESSVGWGYEKIGNAVIAEFDSVVYQMQRVIDNIEGISQKYFNQVNTIKEEYTWEKQTKKALDALIGRIGIEQLGPYLGSQR